MSLRIERIWVRSSEGVLGWPRHGVGEIMEKVSSWPEVSNLRDFTQAVENGQDLFIDEENFKWSGAGSRNIEDLRFILSLCTEPSEVWVQWDDGSPMDFVWPV